MGDLFTAADGRAERDAALDLFEVHRVDYLNLTRRVSMELASEGKIITINDVRDVCPVPEGVNPKVLGAVFRSNKTWERVGYVASARAHSRPISQWRLKNV